MFPTKCAFTFVHERCMQKLGPDILHYFSKFLRSLAINYCKNILKRRYNKTKYHALLLQRSKTENEFSQVCILALKKNILLVFNF